MVRIRLRRVGAKKQASYRIVVIKSEAAATGRPIETIGHFNPRTEPETYVIKEDRALYWLSVGAQPSDAVLRLLKKHGTMDKLARIKAGEQLETDEEEIPAGEMVPPMADTAEEEE
jgi:small subunit ribosomal protein S16